LLPPLHKPNVPEIVAAQGAVPNQVGGQAGEADAEMNGGEAGKGKHEGKGKDGDECMDEAEAEGRSDEEGRRQKRGGPNVYTLAREMEAGEAGKGKGKLKDRQGLLQGQPYLDNQGKHDHLSRTSSASGRSRSGERRSSWHGR
ncbi:hypothetical protein FRC06_010386, partial [Ceratobasidium sp. 370]